MGFVGPRSEWQGVDRDVAASLGVTRRESEVLNAVVGRLSNAEIAATLFVSERTVESHVSALLRKLDATNRVDLVDRARLLTAPPGDDVEVGSLPTPLDAFVGRGAELTQLVEMVRRHRLVTITGAGGVGKTRLAIEAGRLLRGDVEGGVWFVDLMVARAPADVVEQIALSLGVRVSQGQAIEDRLVEHLDGRHVVLVVDNCEHLVGAAASAIELLLQACPRLRVMATSRQPLTVRGEQFVALGPLPVDGPDGLGSGDAVVLFLDRLQPAPDQPSVLGGIAEICRRVDGLALAIELAAARARTLGVDGVRRRLGEHMQLLSGGRPSDIDHHATLHATLDWSFTSLTAREQVVFDRLGVFVAWFTLDDAIAVVANDDVDEVAVVDAVSVLVDKSLCTIETRDGTTWFRYLEPIRAYAHEHLAIAPENDRRDRHASRGAPGSDRSLGSSTSSGAPARVMRRGRRSGVSRIFERLSSGRPGTTSMTAIEQLAWLATGLARRGSQEMSGWFYDLSERRPDCAMTQLVAATHAFAVRGDLVEGRQRAEHVLELDHPNTPLAHRALGTIAIHSGDYERAIEHLERFAAFAATSPRVIERVARRWLLATALFYAKRDPGPIVEQLIAESTAAGWPTGLALGHQADAAITGARDRQHSLDAYTRVIDIAASVGNWYVEATAQRLRLNVQFAVLPTDELASVTVDVLRRFHAMGDAMNVTHTLSFALVVLADAERLETSALVLGWLRARPAYSADPVGRLADVTATLEESLGDKAQVLIDAGRLMNLDDLVDLATTELDAIKP